jgi:hypothetical protein
MGATSTVLMPPDARKTPSFGPGLREGTVTALDISSDRTAEIARMAGAEVITHLTSRGRGAGIRSAFGYAESCCADLVLIDGDGQHSPDHRAHPERRGRACQRFTVPDLEVDAGREEEMTSGGYRRKP